MLLRARIVHKLVRSRLSRRQTPFAAEFHACPIALAKKRTERTFKLADIGEGITECEVLKWNVKPNATIEHFDLLCEVQSDKATVEITSPFDGILKELLVREGEIAKVGQGLCIIDASEEDDESHAADQPTVEPEDKVHVPASSSNLPSNNAPAAGPSMKSPMSFPRKRHPLDPDFEGFVAATSTPSPSEAQKAEARTLATPSVRHYARELGIPRLSDLWPGSGKEGRIEKADVERWTSGQSSSIKVGSQESTVKSPQIGSLDVDSTVELGRTRWAMWKAMEQSLKIPHFGYSTILDLTNLHNTMIQLNQYIPPQFNSATPSRHLPSVSPLSIMGNSSDPIAESDPNTHFNRMTFLPLLLKALSRAMQDWPLFRSSIFYQEAGEGSKNKPSLTIRPHSDIAIALSTPTGLYTPTIQAVDTKTGYEVMGELRRLSNLGRTVPHGLTPKDMPKRGATITVSNVGAIGKGEFAAPLLVPGGGIAIVAIGRAKWVQREYPGDRRLEVGVSWSADHRVVEGAELAAFTETWREWVENPGRWTGDGR